MEKKSDTPKKLKSSGPWDRLYPLYESLEKAQKYDELLRERSGRGEIIRGWPKIAQKLGVSLRQAKKWGKQKDFPIKKKGKIIWGYETELKAWLNRNSQT